MIQLEISYELRAGVEGADYDTCVREVAVPWWQNRQGFRAIRGFYTLIGSGARIAAQIDFDHWDNLAAVLASPEYLTHHPTTAPARHRTARSDRTCGLTARFVRAPAAAGG